MHALRLREVAGGAVLGRHGEDVAAGDDGDALAIRGGRDAGDVAGDVDESGTGGGGVLADGDGHDGGFTGGEVKPPDLAGLLEDDGVAAEGGELDVVVGEVRHLDGLLGGEVVAEEVGAGRAFGDEVDAAVGGPHGEEILRGVIGDVLEFAGLQVEDPDVVGHAAAVLFPGAEFAKDAVVGDLGVIGGVGGKAAPRDGQLGREIAGEADGAELADERVEGVPAGAEDDLGGGVAPAHDDVVRAHAVGEVVAVERGGDGEACGHAARGGHGVDLGVTVVLGGEGELLAVGRIAREDGVARAVGEAAGGAAGGGHGVELAAVGEGDVGAVGGGEAQQAGACVGGGLLGGDAAGAQGQQHKGAE